MPNDAVCDRNDPRAIRVSVLMPAYNAEPHIGKAIESILGQSFGEFEFIILDDASGDATWTIIQKYASKDPRIVALKRMEHRGIAATRNELLARANGRYIVWQDADDVSMAKRIAHQYEFMEHHGAVGICGGSIKFICDDAHDGYVRAFPRSDMIARKMIFRYSPVFPSASMVRRSVMEQIGGFDASLPQAEDFDASIRIGARTEFANLDEVVLEYRYDEHSVSYRRIKENIACTFLVRARARKLGYAYGFFDRIVNAATYATLFLPVSAGHLVAVFDVFRSFDLKYHSKDGIKKKDV